MLSRAQVEFYHEHGWLHIPQVFAPTELAAMKEDLDWMIANWAMKDAGWTGPWRDQLMNKDDAKKSQLVAMHDLHYYTQSWCRAVNHPRLVESMVDLLGPDVELHHSTMHVKPPENGHLFPMHQDWAFYKHADDRYVDVLVHLNDTSHENGEIRFLDGSNKWGALDHITVTPAGPCTPHLPQDRYRLEDTVAVPAKAGDVVLFNIFTIHGSYLNRTHEPRRLVRVGYRHPENVQLSGQSCCRPAWMVAGRRQRPAGAQLFTTEVAVA